MRISSLAALLLLAGCGGDSSVPDADGNGPRADNGAQAADTRIECALGGAGFARVCTLEEEGDLKGARLTVRHPDGGFRRLLVAADGSVSTADGAEAARVAGGGPGHVEVTVGRDRYRLPGAEP
jgi:hypothetical protein